ncbi:MAG TPA: hypothetical protein VMT20_07105 [Terriglobia bacterium]|nr:hypothetical protein [Terriglobia bacterium]
MASFLPPAVRAGMNAANKAAKPNAGPRQSAVAGHLGAPKAQPKAKPPAKPVVHPQGVSKPQGFQPGQLPNKGQIHNEAVTQARLERRALLSPLEGQQRQIQANEASAQQQYGKLLGAENEQFQKLGEGAAASAKTFENNTAEQALQQAKAIETTGQTQATMTGGYASPELRAQLAAGTQDIASQAGAQSQFAQNLATAGQNEIAQMRGAAALKGLGGSQALTNAFQKQSAKVGEEIGAANAKTAGLQSKIQNELAQKYFTDYATAQGLGLKQLESQQKARETSAKINATRAGQKEAVAQRETASRRTAEQKETASLRGLQWKETHPTGKSTNAPKAPSPAEGRKYMGNVSKAQALALQQGISSKTDSKRLLEVRKYLQGLGYNGDEVSAAMNLAYYGVLGPNDRRTAEAYGLTKKMRPEWFKPHK